MAKRKSLEPDPAEIRGNKILERLEKWFKRPETRFDAQKMLGQISADSQAYAKHLVVSGPSSNEEAAKALGFTLEKLEETVSELERAMDKLRGKPTSST